MQLVPFRKLRSNGSNFFGSTMLFICSMVMIMSILMTGAA